MKVLHRDMKSANVFLMKYPNQNYYCVKIGKNMSILMCLFTLLMLVNVVLLMLDR